MECRCGEFARQTRVHTFRRDVAGVVFSAEVMVDSCSGCGASDVPDALVDAFERAIATDSPRIQATIGRALELLATPIAFTDQDIADALDVDVSALQPVLREMRERAPDSSRAEMLRAAKKAGIDPNKLLPRAKAGRSEVSMQRVTPMTWRPCAG